MRTEIEYPLNLGPFPSLNPSLACGENTGPGRKGLTGLGRQAFLLKESLKRPTHCLMIALALCLGATPASAEELHAAISQPPAQLQKKLLDLQTLPLVLSPTPDELAAGIAVTQQTASETSLTIPNLWWEAAQVDNLLGNDLILTWVAYRNPDQRSMPRIDMAVNSARWSTLDYLTQYAFINQFGQAAKSYGYQLRIFAGETMTGAYICDFEPFAGSSPRRLDPAQLNQTPCLLSLDYRGPGGLRGRSANDWQQP